ncbi:MAG: hypothetical protein ABFR05_02100 [Bacteroidota bacterium]
MGKDKKSNKLQQFLGIYILFLTDLADDVKLENKKILQEKPAG